MIVYGRRIEASTRAEIDNTKEILTGVLICRVEVSDKTAIDWGSEGKVGLKLLNLSFFY